MYASIISRFCAAKLEYSGRHLELSEKHFESDDEKNPGPDIWAWSRLIDTG